MVPLLAFGQLVKRKDNVCDSVCCRDAKRKHIQLVKDRRVFASRISEMQSSCNTMMTDKFGRIVDLEKLETVTVNRNVEELKEKLRDNETQYSKELQSWTVS